jgi:hypothetical protein
MTHESPRRGSRAAAGTDQNQASTGVYADPVDEILANVRRFEFAARAIADDKTLSVKARCRALIQLMAKARRGDAAAFLETAVWRGCRHFFEGDGEVPRDIIEANHRLIRRGHDRCPECRRPLPSVADLRRWRELRHDYRRPA